MIVPRLDKRVKSTIDPGQENRVQTEHVNFIQATQNALSFHLSKKTKQPHISGHLAIGVRFAHYELMTLLKQLSETRVALALYFQTLTFSLP